MLVPPRRRDPTIGAKAATMRDDPPDTYRRDGPLQHLLRAQAELHGRQDARGSCRSPHEAVRGRVRAHKGTPALRRSVRLRKARRAPVRPCEAPRRAAPSPACGACAARRGRAVRARRHRPQPRAHGPVDRPSAKAGRDAGVGRPLGGPPRSRGLVGAARKRTNPPAADGDGAPRRAAPAPFPTVSFGYVRTTRLRS